MFILSLILRMSLQETPEGIEELKYAVSAVFDNAMNALS